MAAPVVKLRGYLSKVWPAPASRASWCQLRQSSTAPGDSGTPPEPNDPNKGLTISSQARQWVGTRWEKTKLWWLTDPPGDEARIKDEDFPGMVTHNTERDFYEMMKRQAGHTAPILPNNPLDGKYKQPDIGPHYPVKWKKIQGWDFEVDDTDLLKIRWRNKSYAFQRENHANQFRLNLRLDNQLGAANFICYNGGAVKFHHHPYWIKKDAKGMYSLPPTATQGLALEAIDASGVNMLSQVVFDHFDALDSLIYLNISNQELVDDYCLARLYRVCPNIEFLDVSKCPRVTHHGIIALYNLKSLELLNMTDTPAVQHRGLVTLLLEDHVPGLKVQGVTEADMTPPAGVHPVCESHRVAAHIGAYDYDKISQPSEAEILPKDKEVWEVEDLMFTPKHKWDQKYQRRLLKVDW